jgi:hypothetical protein
MVNYHFYVSPGDVTDYGQVLWAVTQLGLVFACAGYVMPIATITFGKPEVEEEDGEDIERVELDPATDAASGLGGDQGLPPCLVSGCRAADRATILICTQPERAAVRFEPKVLVWPSPRL